MASGKSTYLEKKLLDLVFGGTAYTPPATLYFALSTALYDPDGGPTEPSGGNYSRASITNNTTNWPAASGTPVVKSNNASITFSTPTGAWGTIRSAYVMDASTSGNVLYGGDLTAPNIVVIGLAPTFEADTLSFQED